MVSWYLIEDVLDSGPKSIGFPDINPCDGSLSFPDLGEAPFNGSAPVIIYDAACGAYVKTALLKFSIGKHTGDVIKKTPRLILYQDDATQTTV